MYASLKKKQLHVFLVLCGILIGMLVESMLEVQAGTIFISLFVAMLPHWGKAA
jgi:hypothetical protein